MGKKTKDKGKSQEKSRFSAPFRLQGAGGKAREYKVSLVKAGFVRRRDGELANWYIPSGTIMAAVEAGSFDDLACYVDHADFFTDPSIERLCGVFHSPIYNEVDQTAEATLQLYERDDLAWLASMFDQILANAENGGPKASLGFSLSFFGSNDWQEGQNGEVKVTTDFGFVESCDVVFTPGADGRLKEMLSAAGVEFNSSKIIDGAMPLSTVGGVTVAKTTKTLDGEGIVPEKQPDSAVVAPEPAQVSVSADDGILAQLKTQGDQIAALTAALAKKVEPDVIQGMGEAPRQSVLEVLGPASDEFGGIVDYLFGVNGAKTPEPLMRKADVVYQALTGDNNWRGVFDGERSILSGADTATLPGMATDAMNKVIQEVWGSLKAYRWYEQIVAVVPNDGSIQDMKWIGVGGVGALPVVPEGGAYDELDLADTKETDAFTKYGGYTGITLEMFRKSEIAKIQAVPKSLARSAVQTRSSKFATIFTGNSGVGPILDQDSTALFHVNHGNVATTAFGTDSVAWNAVDLAIWNQTDVGSGKKLAISPKFMLCNRALFRAALVVFGYGDGQPTSYIPEAVSRGDEDPRPWPIAVPDFSDTNDWAAVVDPNIYPVIMASYAQGGNGHPPPELFSVVSPTAGLVFSNDKLPVKIRDWFAFGVNGYRVIAKRNVAKPGLS